MKLMKAASTTLVNKMLRDGCFFQWMKNKPIKESNICENYKIPPPDDVPVATEVRQEVADT